MALPSSGQISFSNVRTEMEQTSLANYTFGLWAAGNFQSNVYAPINVHSSNSGKYDTVNPLNLNQWRGYDRSLNYACDGTNRSLFFSYTTSYCYVSSMVVFDAGTSNASYNINIAGSASDFTGVGTITVYYGRPWQTNGGGYNSATVIYTNNINGAALTTTINYNYVYDSGKGQYIYVVIYGFCT